MTIKLQWIVFGILLIINVLLAFVSYAWMPFDQLGEGNNLSSSLPEMPRWLLALSNSLSVLFLYGLLGAIGLWFSNKLNSPGIFRENANWKNLFLYPLIIGLIIGVFMVVLDRFFASLGDWQGFSHPLFPFSVIASATAGIGEEIFFRLFMIGLWGCLLNFLIGRWVSLNTNLRIANFIAAIAFSAAHLPISMLLFKVDTPAKLPAIVLLEVFLLNSIVGLVAGERFVKDGLVAAVGVHFWADIIWHVVFPL